MLLNFLINVIEYFWHKYLLLYLVYLCDEATDVQPGLY